MWTPNRRSVMGALAAGLMPGIGWGDARAKRWAVPITMAGVPVLHRVTDRLYRSAQPTAQGFANLAALGVKTVVSLRQTVDDAPLAQGTGLRLVQVPMKTRHVSDDDSAKVVLAMRGILAGMQVGPTLVHCTHGADRTGMMMALWRIMYQGWTREEALAEMIDGGFGFHAVWANIPRYLRAVDLVDLKLRIDA